MVHQLRKSYSLTDLGHDENDYGATITEHRAITSDPGKVDSSTFFLEYSGFHLKIYKAPFIY